MIDYCLKLESEAAFDKLMLEAGLCVETDKVLTPADYTILIDRIGPFAKGETVYPEYHANVRFLNAPTDQQAKALEPYAVSPSEPYRVWL